MTTRIFGLLLMLIAVAWAWTPVYAQEEPDVESGQETTAGEDSRAPEGDPLEAARAKGGDILIMRSGAIMSGVQILKSTPRSYEIQVVPNMAPLVIPRRQVERVEYDDIDPARDARHEAKRPKPQDDLMTDGKELSPELVDALIKPLPGTPLSFEKKDYSIVFAQLGEACGVQIVIDPSLKRDTPQARVWTVEIAEGTRLMDVLQKMWLGAFENGKITYEFERVVLHKKDVVPKPPAENKPGNNAAPEIKINLNRGGN